MILDMNISWGNWPFQKDRFSTVKKLKSFLRKNGIGGGLVRSAEAAFAPDLEYCNEKLFAEFKDNDDFIPVPTVILHIRNGRNCLLQTEPCQPLQFIPVIMAIACCLKNLQNWHLRSKIEI
jgi:hypothetical protein